MYVPSLNLKIKKINVVLKRELCCCGYFTASLHRCCSFNPSVSLVNINPLSPSIHIQILQTDLHTFPLRISWENLIKHQGILSFMIIFYILTTWSLDNVWTLLGENCCWSLLVYVKSMLLIWTLPYQGLLSHTCTLKNKTLQPNAEILRDGWRQRVLITLSFLEPPSSQKPIFIGLWKDNCLCLGIGTLGGSWTHLLFY